MAAKKQLLAQFDLHHVLFNNSIEGITEVESNKSIAPPMNPIKWVAGHLIWTQNNIAKAARVELDIPWADHFAPGKPAAEFKGDKTVSLEEIKAKWNEINPKIREGLDKMPDVVLDKKIDSKLPITSFDDSLGGLLAFLNSHRAFYIGQLAILRRGYNKEAMKYFAGY